MNGGVGTMTTWGTPMANSPPRLRTMPSAALSNRTGLVGGFDVVGLRFAPEGSGLLGTLRVAPLWMSPNFSPAYR